MDTVGSGCMSCSIPGMEDAGCIFLFGYNPADSHPIVARRIVRAKEKGCKIIVADPRSEAYLSFKEKGYLSPL